MCILSKPCFHNETAAYKHLEALLWPVRPVCPHCSSLDKGSMPYLPKPRAWGSGSAALAASNARFRLARYSRAITSFCTRS